MCADYGACSDNEASLQIAPRDHLLHQKTGHDGLARARVVGQQESQRLYAREPGWLAVLLIALGLLVSIGLRTYANFTRPRLASGFPVSFHSSPSNNRTASSSSSCNLASRFRGLPSSRHSTIVGIVRPEGSFANANLLRMTSLPRRFSFASTWNLLPAYRWIPIAALANSFAVFLTTARFALLILPADIFQRFYLRMNSYLTLFIKLIIHI